MAILGKDNVVEMARSYNAPYWKIYESEHKRTSGNFVAIADFDNPNLALETSLDKLRSDLNRLTPGRYVFVSFKNNSSSKGMMDTLIEIEGGSSSAAVSGIGSSPEFFMAGIGKITADNFEEAIEKKMRQMTEEQRQKDEHARLKKEVEDLRKQISENDAGFNKGVLTIGSIAYGMMSQTPAGKEFIGMAKQALFATKRLVPGAVEQTDTATPNAEISGTDDDRLVNAVETLSKDNPDWLGQLEKLAALKENDPNTFEMAVGSLDSL